MQHSGIIENIFFLIVQLIRETSSNVGLGVSCGMICRAALLLAGSLPLGACSPTDPATPADVAIPAECRPAAPFTVPHPAWATNASLYQVNVRQYTPEGTFQAFEKHLPRLQKWAPAFSG
ncbi:MAG: hypothetical protein WKG07_43505 [Hymenobacter sp.]